MLIKLFESEIDFELRDFFSHCLSKVYNIWHSCGLACSNSRLVRFWHSQNLTNLELAHKLDLRLKKFYKHRPMSTNCYKFNLISVCMVFNGHNYKCWSGSSHPMATVYQYVFQAIFMIYSKLAEGKTFPPLIMVIIYWYFCVLSTTIAMLTLAITPCPIGPENKYKTPTLVPLQTVLTLSLLNKLSSAKFLVCFNFQSALNLLKDGENVVWVSNSLDPGEMPSYSASHPDPSCLSMAL